MAFDTMDKILTYAIEREEHAARFYTNLANRDGLEHMKEMLLGFAEEEKGHRAKLMDIKEGKKMFLEKQKVLDLKIGDNLAETYPVTVYLSESADRPIYKVLLGPLNQDESGALLYQFRTKGYPDAFVRKGMVN